MYYFFNCDMRFIPKEAIFKLVAANNRYIIVSASMKEMNPLFAHYHKDLKEQVKINIEKGHLKMKDFIRKICSLQDRHGRSCASDPTVFLEYQYSRRFRKK